MRKYKVINAYLDRCVGDVVVKGNGAWNGFLLPGDAVAFDLGALEELKEPYPLHTSSPKLVRSDCLTASSP